MNENIQKWVDALRSGEYKQGKNRLVTIRDGQEFYCCLGVACEIFLQENPDGLVTMSTRTCGSNRENVATRSYDGHTTGLPTAVQSWLGVNDHHTIDPLIGMNDRGESFERIANKIEAVF